MIDKNNMTPNLVDTNDTIPGYMVFYIRILWFGDSVDLIDTDFQGTWNSMLIWP